MDNINFLGYRFRPTEDEIITYFLERKMRGLDFPVHAINEVDLCKSEPWELPGIYIYEYESYTHQFDRIYFRRFEMSTY